jgi:hypothetical protein
MEYILYCDESDAKGKFYSNFYGGILVRSKDLEPITKELAVMKTSLGFGNELKWQKITANYEQKYIDFIDLLFDFLKDDLVKIRIMFTQNLNVPPRHADYQREHKYFLLYYQFIKHAFGLQYALRSDAIADAKIRLHLDKMPDSKEKVELFKSHILALNKAQGFINQGLLFKKDQIAEIDSKEHILSQGLDLVLGAIQFRLNDKHLEKPEGSRVRGKRTMAKERVYKHINKRIREIYPNFNIGVGTSDRGLIENRWLDPYRHWIFIPNGSVTDNELGKN